MKLNREKLIRMAFEAGGSSEDASDLLTIGALERFAEMIAAAERARWIEVSEDYSSIEGFREAMKNNDDSEYTALLVKD